MKLFEKLEQFLVDLHLESKEIAHVSATLDGPNNHGNVTDPASSAAHEVSSNQNPSCSFSNLIANWVMSDNACVYREGMLTNVKLC